MSTHVSTYMHEYVCKRMDFYVYCREQIRFSFSFVCMQMYVRVCRYNKHEGQARLPYVRRSGVGTHVQKIDARPCLLRCAALKGARRGGR